MESRFQTKRLPVARDAIAPDGSDVRVLLEVKGGGLAHFELAPGQTSLAVKHRTVDEVWFFLQGRGELWRQQNGREEVVPVEHGVCLTIPQGTIFQFRSFGYEPLGAIGLTSPCWSTTSQGEATIVKGKWSPTISSGHRL